MIVGIHVTKHTESKLMNLASINSNTLNNRFCKNQYNNKNKVCHYCYNLYQFSTYRPALPKCFNRNDNMLSRTILKSNEIPYLNYSYIRYNSYGEILNKVHFLNYCTIARNNRQCNFTLYTKRIKLIQKYKQYIPSNMLLILSSSYINKQAKLIKPFHKIFSVYTEDHIKCYEDTFINCNGKCFKCMKCYNPRNKTVYINEVIKPYTSKSMDKVRYRIQWAV